MPPLLMDFLYIPALVAFLPILLYQRVVQKKRRGGWRERFGFVAAREADRPAIWVHAVSLGEVNATRALVDEIQRRMPDYEVVVSTTTDTGHEAACRRYGAARVFRYPLDFSMVVRRVLRRVRPAAIVLMELEVWPNLITLAYRRGVPVGIANGRVTEERSMRRFRKPVVRTLARSMFSRIAWIGAQDERYAARFAELGTPVDRIVVTGSMKYDTAVVADGVPGAEELARSVGIDRSRPLLVAGSTGPGEEELLLDAYAGLRAEDPAVQLAIIPRKPERFEEVARLVERRGFACVRRSRQPDGMEPPGVDGPAVWLGDTMGELRKFYSLARWVFVGRTLVPMGGSDLMEVAGLGKAMCFGPYVENFADSADKLRSAGAAVQAASPVELEPMLRRLMAHPEEAAAMGRKAQEVVRDNQGATKRTVDLLFKSLGKMGEGF
jgi:3-deoxy-D-manno-octulosonic-acid transferase